MMKTYVKFRSDHFPPYDFESEELYPGRWSLRVAEFLREKLRKAGFNAREPEGEDWGWSVPVADKPFSLWIGCYRNLNHHDEFVCFIQPSKPFVRSFLRKLETRQYVEPLQESMDKVLADAGIRDRKWWTLEQVLQINALPRCVVPHRSAC